MLLGAVECCWMILGAVDPPLCRFSSAKGVAGQEVRRIKGWRGVTATVGSMHCVLMPH